MINRLLELGDKRRKIRVTFLALIFLLHKQVKEKTLHFYFHYFICLESITRKWQQTKAALYIQHNLQNCSNNRGKIAMCLIQVLIFMEIFEE